MGHDLTVSANPAGLALLDIGRDEDQLPIYVLPGATLQLDSLSLTDVAGQAMVTDVDGSDLVVWFPFFQLQRNATLLLTDLTAYINPADNLQARGLCLHTAAAPGLPTTGQPGSAALACQHRVPETALCAWPAPPWPAPAWGL